MKYAYFDANYLFKLHSGEAGSREVRELAAGFDVIASSLHGRAEFVSAAHRKIREGAGSHEQLKAMLAQVHFDASQHALLWLPVDDAVVGRVEQFFSGAPVTVVLRAADALHLACAAEHGFDTIHSNDRKLLAAAPLFGIRGVDVIGT